MFTVIFLVSYPLFANNGCTDINACNYNINANFDDGSCEYPEEYYDCNGNCVSDTDQDGVCNEIDNCPNDYNPTQEDFNFDNIGDACDVIALDEEVANRTLIQVVDVLYRKIPFHIKHGVLLYIYDDGTVEKKHFLK